jgi:hypothetical protein
MKKNYTMVFTIALALIALCAFWGCSSSDDDDDGPSLPYAEEASLGDVNISLATGEEQVYNADGSEYKPGSPKEVWTYSSETSPSYSDDVAGLSSIDADGKLTLDLPVFTYWDEVEVSWHTDMGFTTVKPPDVRTAHVGELSVGASSGSRECILWKTNGTSMAEYIYADKDAVITGKSSPNEEGGTMTANLILKKGWNLAIGYNAPDGSISLASGDPGPAFRWEVFNKD